MASTLAQHVALDKSNNDDHYISKYLPQRLGNAAPIAYGGYAIGLAIHAACKTAPAGFHLFSAVGHFLRPVSTDTNLICRSVQLRQTKNFVTYRISVEQRNEASPNDTPRLCMEVLTDFHKDEPSVLTYSAPPTRAYSHWRDCKPWERLFESEWAQSGKVTENQVKQFTALFGLSQQIYEGRPCPEGVTAQNLMGMAKAVVTSQEALGPTEKSSADWIRVKHSLSTDGEQMASVGFIMDGALAFLPLANNHLFFDDVSACSSLDFSLRFFTPRPEMEKWHLREMVSHCAGQGRSFSESRLWDERGNLVACMSQQSILRAQSRAKM
ncbi:thioesterase-like superfamily-domain-containing protein [Aspergillus ambiguus]|uniref:thioesterase family protein n=1 Tax=Aspergillus ambiguus TaxID=176160 RepID=UPI003CCD4A3E